MHEGGAHADVCCATFTCEHSTLTCLSPLAEACRDRQMFVVCSLATLEFAPCHDVTSCDVILLVIASTAACPHSVRAATLRSVCFHWCYFHHTATERITELVHVLLRRSTVVQLEDLAGKVSLLKGDVEQDRAVASLVSREMSFNTPLQGGASLSWCMWCHCQARIVDRAEEQFIDVSMPQATRRNPCSSTCLKILEMSWQRLCNAPLVIRSRCELFMAAVKRKRWP